MFGDICQSLLADMEEGHGIAFAAGLTKVSFGPARLTSTLVF